MTANTQFFEIILKVHSENLENICKNVPYQFCYLGSDKKPPNFEFLSYLWPMRRLKTLSFFFSEHFFSQCGLIRIMCLEMLLLKFSRKKNEKITEHFDSESAKNQCCSALNHRCFKGSQC